MKRILIFSSHTGGGHMSLAEAIGDLVRGKYDVEIIDPQLYLFNFHYLMVSRHAPWLWNTEYKLSDGKKRAKLVHEIAKPSLVIPIRNAILRFKPNLIMSTYPLVTSAITYSLRRFKIKLPFAMLFSDPNAVHHVWLTEKNADAVFAPTLETYNQALQSGFDPSRIHYTGWPVRQQFHRISLDTRDKVFMDLGLSKDRFTIFLQGGAEGTANFTRTVENLLDNANIQIILATGTNRKLYYHFQNRNNVHPIKFTREIANYMASADVVMGKAGPNMMFETITLGKPFIATAYIPGQEEINLEFIERHGLGWVALDKREQNKLLETLSTSPDKIKEKLESIKIYQDENLQATKTIPSLIDQLT